jgi:DNA-directed RNA polymerase specialized sigma24 family protein
VRADKIGQLRQAIWELSEQARLHLLLSRAESLSLEEVAHLLGCSVEVARQELRKAEAELVQAVDSILTEEREAS